MKITTNILGLLMFSFCLTQCDFISGNYFGGDSSYSQKQIPKPKGYLRIDIPTSIYEKDTTGCGLVIERPHYSLTDNLNNGNKGSSCFFNVLFPKLNSRLYCTEMQINGNVDDLIKNEYIILNEEKQATGIHTSIISNINSNIGGELFYLKGPVATPIRFYVTDYDYHFFRGFILFDNSNNSDSILTVVEKLHGDIEHLMRSIEWE